MRTYDSSRRRRQAEATRADILAAARRVFGEHGYAGASVAAIAEAAGVAVPTVYASAGSKRELLLSLVDAIDEQAGVPQGRPAVFAAEDPREVVRNGVRLTRQIQERCGDIISALFSAAPFDEEAAVVAKEGRSRHADGTRRIARHLERVGALKPGLTAERAAQVISLMTAHETYMAMIRQHGWSWDQCEKWIAEALEALVLA